MDLRTRRCEYNRAPAVPVPHRWPVQGDRYSFLLTNDDDKPLAARTAVKQVRCVNKSSRTQDHLVELTETVRHGRQRRLLSSRLQGRSRRT
jgi:hypothetical protein